MDIEKLRDLLKRESEITEETMGFFEIIFDAKANMLNENLDDTMAFIDTCTEFEFLWMSNAFDEVSEKYKSTKFIECIKRNALRFPEIAEEVKVDLEYATLAMEDNK